jgi:hypothetical protein
MSAAAAEPAEPAEPALSRFASSAHLASVTSQAGHSDVPSEPNVSLRRLIPGMNVDDASVHLR